MELPSKFIVPDFILQAVSVAPEEWPKCTDAGSARGRLKELNMIVANPDMLYILGRLVIELSRADADIDEHKFAGLHDVLIQQQLIGEKRGYRRVFVEIEDIRNELKKVIKDNE